MGGGSDAAPARASLRLVGADGGAVMAGRSAQTGKVNYFQGNDPAAWRTDVPTFGRVVATGVYPGVNLAWHGAKAGRGLEYDFIVAPGADPSPIAVAVGGAESLTVDPSGDLVARLSGRTTFRQHAPVAYQHHGNKRTPVRASFRLDGDQVRFSLGHYDTTRPLVIDPVLTWSTYLGGDESDFANAMDLDAAGNVYVAGTTRSFDFPVTPGSYDTDCGTNGDGTCNGPTQTKRTDLFVAKFSPAGALVYATYVGGTLQDSIEGLGADYISASPTGMVLVGGTTQSADFPTVNSLRPCPLPPTPDGRVLDMDAVVFKLNAAGNKLKFSTCFGAHGSGNREETTGTALDVAGNAYVVGTTDSPTFPTQNSADMGDGGRCLAHSGDPDISELRDAFVAKFDPAGNLVYASCWGGLSTEVARAVDVDTLGNAYVVGWTDSTSFPQKNNAGIQDGRGESTWQAGFVLKVSPKPKPVFSSFFGGNDFDDLFDVVVNGPFVYLAGATGSTDFATKWPTATAGAYQPGKATPQNPFRFDAFVARLGFPAATPNAPVVDRLTYLGGSEDDVAWGMAVRGGVWVTGQTRSATDDPNLAFPQVGALQPACALDHPSPNPYRGAFYTGNAPDAFVTRLDKKLRTVTFSTCLGGTGEDQARNVAVDTAGNAYVAGFTLSPEADNPETPDVESPFPTTEGAFDRTCGTSAQGLCRDAAASSYFYDGFVAKISPG